MTPSTGRRKRALITGISGMDGSHLADFLLNKGYEVHGLIRRHAISDAVLQNIYHIRKEIELHAGDMTDAGSLNDVVAEVKPDEVYNLAAQSFVGTSWRMPRQTAEVNAVGVVNILEACRKHAPEARIYQASTSEMFGKSDLIRGGCDEETPFYPRSPYGVAKLYGHWMCVNYRESYDQHISCGILFNHESERRGIDFVTQKIAHGVAKIHLGLADHITLGNLDAQRDWGYAPEYVEAMWLMLQQDKPDDYVIGTGEVHSVNEFLEQAFEIIGCKYPHEQNGLIRQDPRFMRPADVEYLKANSQKARQVLGWKPSTTLRAMVIIMVQAQVKKLRETQ